MADPKTRIKEVDEGTEVDTMPPEDAGKPISAAPLCP